MQVDIKKKFVLQSKEGVNGAMIYMNVSKHKGAITLSLKWI
jgi:hypothetical protein